MHLKFSVWPAMLAFLGVGLATPAVAAGTANCALSATSLAFGQYVPSRGTPADFTATLTLTCTASGASTEAVAGTIALTGANGSSGRALTDGTHRLRYRLYADPGRRIAWGDGTGDGTVQSFSGTAGSSAPFRQSFTLYGRILARQSDALVGSYTDQITAVLNY